jgi:2-methylcitrate dehydratase PrpD
MKRCLPIAAVLVCFAIGGPPRTHGGAAVLGGQNSSEPITFSLARLAIETGAGDIPGGAFSAAKAAVMDALGCAFAGHAMPGVREVMGLTKEWGGRGEATLWLDGTRVPAPAAAFANSALAHAMDLDDYHPPSDTHIGVIIVPVALAMGELTGATGGETLAAAILGVEVAGRLGRIFKARRTHEGFLPSSVVGGFGATAAACRLKRLSVEQTANALGIFYAHASGNRQALFDRTLTKRVQPAIAARAAVIAACLAERGITGPARVVEGEAGLLKLYGSAKGDPPDAAAVSTSPGQFEVERIRFKRFACCGRSHGAIEAAIGLANEHDLGPDDIAEVELFGLGVNSGMVGVPWDPHHPIPHVLAQFCAPYEVAAAIKNRRMGAAEISDARIRADRDVSELAARTLLRDPKEFGGRYPGGQAVRIRTNQGQTLVASQSKGGPSAMSEAELIAKFKDNVALSGLCPPGRAEALLQAIRQLDRCEDVSGFVGGHLVFPEVAALGPVAGAVAPGRHPSKAPGVGTTDQTATRVLSELAIGTPADEISPEAYHAAKRAVLDVVGVTLAAHDAPGIAPIVDQMRDWGGKPEATVWVFGDRLPGPAATFVNSTLAHALDLDDVHLPSITHITCVVVPVALAVGEAVGASGKETLAAIAMGVEVAARLAVPEKRRLKGGFLPSSVLGGFGATAAACRLKGCTVDQTVNALGIFYAHASGNRQALLDHTLTKRIQPAIAARAGVFAAHLAQRGVTGPGRVVEGEAGLFGIYGVEKGEIPTAADVAGKRAFWEIERVSFKKFASCGASHPIIQGAIDLANEHGLKAEDIAGIELFGVGVNSGMVGVPWDPRHPIPHVMAQFCAPYEVASAIQNRRMGPAEITNEKIRADEAVSDLAARVELKNPKQFGGEYPGGQTIRIRTRDGRSLVASRDRDHVLRPDLFGDEALIGKFMENAAFSALCPPARANAIRSAVWELDACDDIARFVRGHLIFQERSE